MEYRDINHFLPELDAQTAALEDAYVENGGELTEETEQMEQEINGLRELLSTEGVDLLGQWLKAKEDRKKALKAEKDYISRQMEGIDRSIAFIKEKVSEVLLALGKDKVKGNHGYSFTATVSCKAEVDKDFLKERYASLVEKCIREAGVPEYVGVSLTASVTKANEIGVSQEDDGLFSNVITPTVRFTKPRASKED